MASRARVEEFRSLNTDLVTLAQRDLAGLVAQLDLTDKAAARVALTEYMDALVLTYGRPAALVAAQYYDDLREASPNATGAYRATLADAPASAKVEGTVRWAVGEPDVLAALSPALQRFILQYGRNTIALNSARDTAAGKWARVPSGRVTCKFCLMLASRGPVYRTAESAGRAMKYHDGCDCTPVQIWDGDDLPGGYDPDELYARYERGEFA